MLGCRRVWCLVMKLTPKGNPLVVNPQKTIQFRNRLGSQIVSQLQQNSPKGEDGILAASWRFELTATGIKVINFSGYAPAVEFGVKGPIKPKSNNPGRIDWKNPGGPRKPPKLSFYSQGQWWVLDEVKGQKAQYFVRSTLQAMFPSSNIISDR